MTTPSKLTREDLLSPFQKAENPKAPRIGTEFEAIPLRRGPAGPETVDYNHAIAPILEQLCSRFAWNPSEDRGVDGEIIALQRDGASITLEPGGQLELSGAPLYNVHQTCEEFRAHRKELHEIGQSLGISFLAAGFHPFASRDDIHWMPKDRYAVMRKYLPTRGALALDMMLRTATVQVNLDYPNEKECGRRFVAISKASSLLTALFANSPFFEGKASAYQSYRSRVWAEVDPDRCGLPDFLFDQGFSYERYVDWALSVPMFFIQRNHRYLPLHIPFGEYLEQGYQDPNQGLHQATAKDWNLHLSTLFPEVRLKPFIEVRGADGANHRFLCALPALTKALLYDDEALLELEALVANIDKAQAMDRWERARKHGLQDPQIARDCERLIHIAGQSLARNDREQQDPARHEFDFLNPLRELLQDKKNRAAKMLEAAKTAPLAKSPAQGLDRDWLCRQFYYAGAEL